MAMPRRLRRSPSLPLSSSPSPYNLAENGGVFEVGAGWVAKVQQQRSQGYSFPLNPAFTCETVRDKWDNVCDFDAGFDNPESPQDSFGPILENLESLKAKSKL